MALVALAGPIISKSIDLPSLFSMALLALGNSTRLLSLLLMVLVALLGRIINNSAHLPSLLLMTRPATGAASIPVNEKEGK